MKKVLLVLVCFVACAFGGSMDYIKSNGVIKIGVPFYTPPFGQNQDGVLKGYDIDLAKAIVEEIFPQGGIKIEFVSTSISDVIDLIQKDKVDMVVSDFTITEKRTKMVDFSLPYLKVNFAVLTKNSNDISKEDDLTNKTILVEKDSTAEKFVSEKGLNFKTCTPMIKCYNLLNEGEFDAFIDDNLIVFAIDYLDKSLKTSIDSLSEPMYLAAAVKMGNKELLDAINSALNNLQKSGFLKKNYFTNIDTFFRGSVDSKLFVLDELKMPTFQSNKKVKNRAFTF